MLEMWSSPFPDCITHTLHSRALLCVVVQTVFQHAALHVIWGKRLGPAVVLSVQFLGLGDICGGVKVCSKVTWNCGRIWINSDDFNLPFVPCFSSCLFCIVLIARLHRRLQIALARVVRWKGSERWEGTHLPSTEEIQGVISALTSVADTNRIKLPSAQAPKRNGILAGHTGFNWGGEGGRILKIVN